MLFPNVPIECMVSLGVGSTPQVRRPRGMHTYFEIGSAVMESAIGVDRPHEALAATLDLSDCLYERCALFAFELTEGCPGLKITVVTAATAKSYTTASTSDVTTTICS
jgi:hypothetical protein